MAKIDDFRQRATDCLTLSERSVVARHKELFLRMAQTWLTLADQEASPRSYFMDELPERLRPAPSGSEGASPTETTVPLPPDGRTQQRLTTGPHSPPAAAGGVSGPEL